MATLLFVLAIGLLIGVFIGMKMRGSTAAPQAQQAPTASIAAPKAEAKPNLLKEAWITALGGASNIRAAQVVAATRVRVELQDGAKLNEPALKQAGVQAIAVINQQVFHLIVGVPAV
jgi:phosphotransferase system IIB component